MGSRRADGGSSLYGRQTECASLDELLDQVRGGRSAVLVLRGEAGIGKSALLRYLTGTATDFQVARCVGVESEMELAFTGLHDLCEPLLSYVDALIEPQRAALGVALGVTSGQPPEPFLVAVAALNLLAVAGEKQPLLCVVDDVQWLDHASAQALGFVARRLLAEPVAMVFAARTAAARDDSLAGLPDLRLSGLAEPSARALLTSQSTAPLDESVLGRIVEEARGNPLALMELGAVHVAGGFATPDAVDVPQRIQEQYATRLRALPLPTQRLMLLAAADPVGDPGLLRGAADGLGLDLSAAEPAATAGLLDLDAGVRFRHPLLRSVVYRGADADQRRATHAALAAATDPQLDPDRRAWHRAYAAVAADEEVAAELIGSADRAARRGGIAAAAAFWERAAALTPDPARRAERALAAAEAKFAAGDFVAAQKLLTAADIGEGDELGRARVELMRARIAFKLNRGAEAPAMMLSAARRLRPLDDDSTRQTLLEALLAAVYVGQLAAGAGLREVARSAKAAPFAPDPLPHPQLMLRGLAVRLLDGYAAAVPFLKDALRQYLSEPPQLDMLCHSYTFVATDLWDADAWLEIARRQIQLARPTGTLSRVVEALSVLAIVSIHEGDLDRAEALIAEEERIQIGITQPLISYSKALLAGWRGDRESAEDLMAQVYDSGSNRGEGLALVGVDYARAVLYNGLSDYERALAAAHRTSSADTLGIPDWGLYELVEAAVKSGQPARGSAARDRLSQIAAASGSDWARATATLARALMAEGAAAEEVDELYQEAIERFGRTRMASTLPRAQLCYGEWLRSVGRAAEASTQLRAAFDAFIAMGAKAFAERARRELEAGGERVRTPKRDDGAGLTSQEEQIAHLARTRRTNAEIGALVFLSARTVEWHLHKIFAKLGISSRQELDAALSSRDRQTAAVTSKP